VSKYGKRTRVCLACAKRIRREHPYVGIKDLENKRELRYHASSECQLACAEQLEAIMERGAVYVIHHYHTCGYEEAGFDCSGGCFSGAPVFGVN
jgi:hypothetical protein